MVIGEILVMRNMPESTEVDFCGGGGGRLIKDGNTYQILGLEPNGSAGYTLVVKLLVKK
jgi:hypothetical protein